MTIGVSMYTTQLPLYVEMVQGIQDEAKALGANVTVTDGAGVAQKQISQIDSMVNSGVKAIIASPVDATALVPAYKAAAAAKIPIFSAANKVADQYETGFVGPDLVGYAKQTMDKIIDCMGGKGDLVIVQGPPAISFVQLQEKGWAQSLAAHPNVKVVQKSVDPDLSTAKGVDLTTSALTANPNVKGILASTDSIGEGAVQAVKTAGMKPGSMCIGGWDAEPAAINLIKQGDYTLTLSYLAYKWGQVAAQTAINAANGKMPASHYVLTQGLFIDKSNAATLTPQQITGQAPIG